eukprot:scaffold7964_cov403-Prasinococcus_capsulatus_cf.AAC.2
MARGEVRTRLRGGRLRGRGRAGAAGASGGLSPSAAASTAAGCGGAHAASSRPPSGACPRG